MKRTYRELSRLKTFDERFRYLRLSGIVGNATFGFDRYLNQMLYTSRDWRETRDKVILRDGGLDLGVDPINRLLLVHHIEPLTPEDLEYNSPKIFDLDNLITTCDLTHKAIHYSNDEYLGSRQVVIRRPNDTIPWK